MSASAKKIEANKRNGAKSRGPRSVDGKKRSCRNSLRHGLSTVSRYNPSYFAPIEQMAKMLCGENAHPDLLEQALLISENEIILRCVEVERGAIVEKFRNPYASSAYKNTADIPMAKLSFEHKKQAYEEFSQLYAKLESQGVKLFSGMCPRPCRPDERPFVYKPAPDRDEYEAMQTAFPDLKRLERYERRAWSRRRKAVERFTVMKVLLK